MACSVSPQTEAVPCCSICGALLRTVAVSDAAFEMGWLDRCRVRAVAVSECLERRWPCSVLSSLPLLSGPVGTRCSENSPGLFPERRQCSVVGRCFPTGITLHLSALNFFCHFVTQFSEVPLSRSAVSFRLRYPESFYTCRFCPFTFPCDL